LARTDSGTTARTAPGPTSLEIVVDHECVYRQDLKRPLGETHLKVDEAGADDFFFVDSGIPNSNPSHSYEANGLFLPIERPLGASGNMGEFGAAKMQGVTIPDRFLLVATFGQPTQVSLTAARPAGTYAPALLINDQEFLKPVLPQTYMSVSGQTFDPGD
jgi:hypothetical protein